MSRAVRDLGITYPVLLDTEGVNWQRWLQRYWPTAYAVDRKGVVRFEWIGELEARGANGGRQMEEAIRRLLDEG